MSVPSTPSVEGRQDKKWLWPILLVTLFFTLVIGSWPEGGTNDTNEARTSRVAGEIRCPTCSGLSVAESESPLAQSARAEIATQVAAGRTDEQIQDYFVDRYGNTALMSPPRRGLTAWAWGLPVVLGALALFGIVLSVRKWQRHEAANARATDADEALVHSARAARAKGVPAVSATSDERDYLLASLDNLDAEHAGGTLNDDEYESLRHQQIRRAAALLRNADRPPVKKQLTTMRLNGDKKRQRMMWSIGSASFAVLAVSAVAFSAQDRGAGDSSTGAVAGDAASLLSRAGQQTAEGKPADAIKSYDQVIRLDPQNAQALAYRGWLIRLAGLSAQGEQSIDQAIAADPTYPDARFFKGYVLLRDRNDPAGAVTQFDAFLANRPPPAMVALVEQAREDAIAQISDPTVPAPS